MAEAVFTPAAAPGYAVDAAINGYTSGQSIMQRAQAMRFAQQDQDRQNAQWAVMQPVLQAKGQADIANAQATLQNAAAVQRLRAQFGTDSVQAQQDYQDAMQEASYDNQAAALSRVAQKYAYFSLIPEGKPFLQSVQDQQIQAHQNYMLDSHIDAERDLTDQRAQNAIELEKQKAANMQALYTQIGKGKTQEQRLLDEANEAYANGDKAGGDALMAVINRKGTIPAGSLSQAQQIAQLKTDAARYRAIGENDLADKLEARATYYSNPNAGRGLDPAALITNLQSLYGGGGRATSPAPVSAPPVAPQVVSTAPVVANPTPATAAPVAQAAGKLYVVDPATQTVRVAPNVRDPKQILAAVQQMVDDGVITTDQGRAQLDKLGFKRKSP
jgi:hypothetical protein